MFLKVGSGDLQGVLEEVSKGPPAKWQNRSFQDNLIHYSSVREIFLQYAGFYIL